MFPIRRLMNFSWKSSQDHFECNEMDAESLLRKYVLSIIAFHAVAVIIFIHDDNVPDKTFDDF